ncbi:MAG: prephenate dehydrogenase/arogenate dehydrogenase family protein [Firmicutes bacterium]|nr:prephenate dehydrogenase/arogenate dehydrogenase family protein [Bacillota bacterium]
MVVVGTGLIGGSLALAWRNAGLRVWGIDASQAVVEKALAAGVVEDGAAWQRPQPLEPGPAACRLLEAADAVILAAPVPAICALLPGLFPLLRPGTLVLDTGSTKSGVLDSAWQAARTLARARPHPGGGGEIPAAGPVFVGGHPLAGSEEQGVEAADPYLFQNSYFVLVPGPGVCVDPDSPWPAEPPPALRLAVGLVCAAGALPVVADAADHDTLVALVSHLPHLAAAAVVQTVFSEDAGAVSFASKAALAAGGFRDLTRVASSDPRLWREILVANRAAILPALRRLEANLERLAALLGGGGPEAQADAAGLEEFLRRARWVRGQLPLRRKGLLGHREELVVWVPDRPGEIHALTGHLARAHINIQDLEVLRVREHEGGSILLAFSEPGQGSRAAEILRQQGYAVRCREDLREGRPTHGQMADSASDSALAGGDPGAGR